MRASIGSVFRAKHRQDFSHVQPLPRQKFRESTQLTKYLSVRGKLPALTPIGENDLTADGDLIDAVMSFDQFGFDSELLLNFSRQTGGAVEETSLDTISYPDIDLFVAVGFSAHNFSFHLRLSSHTYS